MHDRLLNGALLDLIHYCLLGPYLLPNIHEDLSQVIKARFSTSLVSPISPIVVIDAMKYYLGIACCEEAILEILILRKLRKICS
jgi:hypothetical protein